VLAFEGVGGWEYYVSPTGGNEGACVIGAMARTRWTFNPTRVVEQGDVALLDTRGDIWASNNLEDLLARIDLNW